MLGKMNEKKEVDKERRKRMAKKVLIVYGLIGLFTLGMVVEAITGTFTPEEDEPEEILLPCWFYTTVFRHESTVDSNSTVAPDHIIIEVQLKNLTTGRCYTIRCVDNR
jgi:hypothetical protein